MLVPFYHYWAGQWGRADFRQEAKWRLADTVPHLPMEVTYLNSGAKWERTVVNRVVTSNEVLVPYSPPYDKGFKEGHYEVIAQTNIGGLTLPTEFRFSEMVPAGYGAVRATRTISGKVHTLYSYCPKKSLHCEFPGDVAVRDDRLRTNRQERTMRLYRSTRIVTTNEAMALLDPNLRRKPSLRVAKPHPWWQGPVAVGALLVPGGVVWWRLRRTKAAKPGGVA